MIPRRCFALPLLLMSIPRDAEAKPPRTTIAYTIRIAPGDTLGFDVEMRIMNPPDTTFRLAMAAHPEYDDRFWRYVQQPRVISMKLGSSIVREDSALWRIRAWGETTVRYRIHLPPADAGQRAAWQPFLRSTGALVGGPQSFMYIVGAERAPSRVRIIAPAGWKIATALEPTSDPAVFSAPNTEILVDSPILLGNLHTWRFTAAGVPHRVVYWPLPNATPFDSVAFVEGIQRVAEQGIALFRRAPYREYVFLMQDGAYGALEHLSSVTIGAPSADLAKNPNALLPETAHEYFHLWNLMRIRPAERAGVDYRPARETRGLWFSEGLSMYYADLLIRRARIGVTDSTRIRHLERLIERYLGNSSYVHISPEEASLAAYRSTPGTLGDYSPSAHLQGEIVGAMLDFVIRDASNGTRSIDDVMRLMLERFSGAKGFDGQDIEHTVHDVCACDVKPFFDSHVRGSTQIDFDRYLGLVGMHARVSWVALADEAGKRQPDLRISAWLPSGEARPRLLVRDPNSVWARGGIHTGDQLVSVNGKPMNSWPEFREVLRGVALGDTLRLEIVRAGKPINQSIIVAGYDRPLVRIEELPGLIEKQRRIRQAWLAGTE